MSIELFDSLGRLCLDAIDPAEIEILPDAERTALFDCIKHSAAAQDGEARRDAARSSVSELNKAYEAARVADHEANPAMTHQQCLMASIAANDPEHYKPAKIKTNLKTRATLAKVAEELGAARAELNRAEAELKILSKTRGDSIVAYLRTRPKVTQESLIREVAARENATRVAIHRGELPAPPEPEPPRYAIDQVLSQRGTQNSRSVKNPRRLPR